MVLHFVRRALNLAGSELFFRFPVITQLFRDVQQKTQTNVPILPWRGFCFWSVLVWFLLRPIAAFKPHDSFLSNFCPPPVPPGRKEGVCSGHQTMQMDSGDAPGVVEEKKKQERPRPNLISAATSSLSKKCPGWKLSRGFFRFSTVSHLWRQERSTSWKHWGGERKSNGISYLWTHG